MAINRIARPESGVRPVPPVLNPNSPSVKRDPRGQPYTGYKRKVSDNDRPATTKNDRLSKDTLELSKEAPE